VSDPLPDEAVEVARAPVVRGRRADGRHRVRHPAAVPREEPAAVLGVLAPVRARLAGRGGVLPLVGRREAHPLPLGVGARGEPRDVDDGPVRKGAPEVEVARPVAEVAAVGEERLDARAPPLRVLADEGEVLRVRHGRLGEEEALDGDLLLAAGALVERLVGAAADEHHTVRLGQRRGRAEREEGGQGEEAVHGVSGKRSGDRSGGWWTTVRAAPPAPQAGLAGVVRELARGRVFVEDERVLVAGHLEDAYGALVKGAEEGVV